MREYIEESILTEIDRTQIIAVGVSDYQNLPKLRGPSKDLEAFKKLLVSNRKTALYQEEKFQALENPNTNELRNTLLEYTRSRSARGDILIFYFSGHGYVSGNGDFSLCLTDTLKGFGDSGILALSALPFSEIIKSLSAVDVYPCFILDACFSAASTKVGHINVGMQIEYEISKQLGNSYAILASSNPDAYSIETKEGGFFTQAICETIISGLDLDQNDPHISIRHLPIPVDKKLSKIGAPLSRLHIGHSFPEIAIAINPVFNPNIRSERFTKAYISLLKYAWNNGDPICFSLDEIRKDLPSGYGNHSKFEYIWGLLEDSQLPNGKRCRRLTQKGIDFMEGNVQIFREMQRDPEDPNRWKPKEGSEQISFEEI
ncbi:MAG: caspase family protein [Brevefilum sp.]|jgi:hypothetical protein